MTNYLEFERPLAEIEGKAEELRAMGRDNEDMDIEAEAKALDKKARALLDELYSKLTPWRKCQVARHPDRPHCKDYIQELFQEYTPLAGDRNFADDHSIMGGLARLGDRPVVVIGHEKGHDTKSRIARNFGMARPVLVSGNKGVQAKGVVKSFNKRRVVRNVSLDLQRGEAVGLLGPNGAGKTTTFYMLAGLLPADEGQVFIDGRDVTSLPIFQRARLGMGYLPQESSIFRGLTVEQNIRAVLETLEDHDDERDATLDDLMAEFGSTHLRNTPSVSLSGGERRRLEIARALAARPTFLLLDEPLAGIDPIARGEIRDLIAHLKTHGIGVLITDHNVRETLDIVDRAYIIHDGTVLMEGTPDEVVQHSGVRQVYLGEHFSI